MCYTQLELSEVENPIIFHTFLSFVKLLHFFTSMTLQTGKAFLRSESSIDLAWLVVTQSAGKEKSVTIPRL